MCMQSRWSKPDLFLFPSNILWQQMQKACADKCKELEEGNAALQADKERLHKEHADLVCASLNIPVHIHTQKLGAYVQ
jgi:hypothetical protein